MSVARELLNLLGEEKKEDLIEQDTFPEQEEEGEKEGEKKDDKKKVDIAKIITELIKTGWSGSNDEQGKAVQLLRGLAFSEDPRSNKFMQALDDFTSKLDPKEFTESFAVQMARKRKKK